MDSITIVLLIVAIVIGLVLGFIVNRLIASSSSKNAAREAASLVEDAKKQAETLRREAAVEAKDEALRYKQEMEKENKERMREVRSAENRIAQREESLDRRVESLDAREHQLSSLQGQVERRERDVEEAENAIERHREEAQIEINQALERAAGMSPQEAKEELLETIHDEVTRESAVIIRDAETRTKAEADKKAREILSLAIQRVAADHSAESTVSTIHIPSDDLKGRIIGREGRNIRSFEQLTGTNLIIDDTPECVTISCFDPVRREIGRVTMENLIADGRIHPARIEEMYDKAVKLVNQRVHEAGEQATFDAGIHDLHPELVNTLGRLRYRTSFGQNVLNHSLEVAYLASVMASELGLDPIPVKRAGLLHDLGKAVDHEVEGSHAVIGADLARRFGERPEIVHAIEAHHNDVEANSVVDVLIQAADAVSAARPGARKETLDAYVKRLEKLEEIANSHKGVERTYAIQAGREVRVMVEPEVVDEAESVVLAHDIAQQIENEMQYPGQVKVVVIRESRAVDYAK
ncbi:ribonuclease Y [Adlercreutzia equolifaciens]|uniref:ribonuclease Y n=1 Tax=Adlercreutzia equolifaciens TaxID=446660 RepID=UPI003A944FEC